MPYMQVLSMPQKIGHDQQWHDRRRKGIGGSESAAVLGLSKWKTPFEVWQDKTGKRPPIKANEAMTMGTMLEPAIRKRYSNETGRTVYDPGFKVDEQYPFIVGDVDGLCQDRILECKNSSYDWDEVPVDYYYQVQHYMRLHNKPLADIAVLIRGQHFQIFTVERDESIWTDILPIYEAFWDCVVKDVPPEITTLADVNSAYRQSKESSVMLSGAAMDSLQKLKNMRADIAAMQSQLEQLEFDIKSELGENAIGTDANGKTVVTWRTSAPRTCFDSKKLKEDNPDLYQKYLTTGSSSRTFLVK